LVDDTPYKTCLNPPFNAIFVESYEYTPKENNYLMKTFFPYLKFFHNFGFSVPTFVELYPSGASKVSRKMMLDTRCCSKNAPWPVLLVYVEIVQHP
jgi:hypothetical protein